MELVILSGKGGTGKTTIAIALSELANDVVRVDCDVDAPNFFLFYQGENIYGADFHGGKKATIDEDKCTNCGLCQEYCRFDAIKEGTINHYRCEGCGTCAIVCPEEAIQLIEEKSAKTFVTKTKKGMISRAEMEIGSEGSGKLITLVRKNGRRYKSEEDITIIDGSPGIGCSVIASISGSDAALIVSEPTKSGMEDFMRVAALCQYFKIPTLVCINKYDLNVEITKKIQDFCSEEGFEVVGEIPYDDVVMKSINALTPIVYYDDSQANLAIRKMWPNIEKTLVKLKLL